MDVKKTSLIIGEALIDMVNSDGKTYAAQVGGSPLNMASCMANLGAKVEFGCSVSNDTLGQKITNRLQEIKIGTRQIQKVQAPTSLALAQRKNTGDVEYTFYLTDTSMASFDWKKLELEQQIQHVHLGSYAVCAGQYQDEPLDFLEKARAKEAFVSFDVNVRLDLTPGRSRVAKQVEKILPFVHLAKISEEDKETLFPNTDEQKLIKKWLDAGCATIAYTRGENGSTIYTQNSKTDYPATRVKHVVDTIGSGDCFMGSLVYKLITDKHIADIKNKTIKAIDFKEAVSFASQIAAYNCCQTGANPPTHQQLKNWQGNI